MYITFKQQDLVGWLMYSRKKNLKMPKGQSESVPKGKSESVPKGQSESVPKGQSESVYRTRTDNTMAKRESTKGQTTIYKT
jgi:hypothetical protein